MEPEANNESAPKIEKKNDLWEIIKFTLIALAIVVPVRIFIAQPFVVSGESMIPTFSNGDYLIIDEISYRFSEPKRGDVIIFRYPNNPDKFFIKRVMGLPGEQFLLKNGEITIINDEHPEGFVIEENYLDVTTEGAVNTTLGEDDYFVMGDNRDESSDSRTWGTLPEKNIIGRAWVRLLPVREIDLLPGAVNLDASVN